MRVDEVAKQVSDLRQEVSELRERVTHNYVELSGFQVLSDKVYAEPMQLQIAGLTEALREADAGLISIERDLDNRLREVEKAISSIDTALKFVIGLLTVNTILIFWFAL